MGRWERVLVLGSALLAGCAVARPPGGPLPVRSQHPAQLTVLHLEPETAAALPAGTVAMRTDASYTSMFLSGSRGLNSFTMDGEYLRLRQGVRVGLGDGFDLAAELPVAHTTGGFLDEFIIEWHDLFGFPDQDRSSVPEGRFRVRAVNSGTEAFAVREANVQLMDIPIRLKWSLLQPEQDGIGLALQAGVELPTGSEQGGFGNGGLDYGAGMLFEWRPGSASVYAHLGYTIAETPHQSRRAGLEFANVSTGGAGIEVPIGSDFAALIQVDWETSTLRNLGFTQASRDQVLLWLGGRATMSRRMQIEFALGEDLTPNVAPDFSVFLGVSWRTGP